MFLKVTIIISNSQIHKARGLKYLNLFLTEIMDIGWPVLRYKKAGFATKMLPRKAV